MARPRTICVQKYSHFQGVQFSFRQRGADKLVEVLSTHRKDSTSRAALTRRLATCTSR
jgi:hypothetical protein